MAGRAWDTCVDAAGGSGRQGPGGGRRDESPAPGAQLVGNDFRSANIIWSSGKIAAVPDLEETTYRRRVDDLAQAAALLGTRYHHWPPTPADVRGAFVATYESVLPLAEDDAGSLEDGIEAHVRRIRWPG